MNIFKKIWHIITSAFSTKPSAREREDISRLQDELTRQEKSEQKIKQIAQKSYESFQAEAKKIIDHKQKIRDSFFPPVIKKWRMKNNRLHIVYNGKLYDERLRGKIQSLRCTKLDRATEIVKRISPYVISKAIFQDKAGKQYTIA